MADLEKPDPYVNTSFRNPAQDTLQKPPGYDELIAPELHEEKYGTPLEQAKTATEGALSSATFGLSTGLEKMLFNNAEQIRERREENPGSHMVGQIVGLEGPGGILGKVGSFGAKALGLGVEGAGLVSRLGASAVKGVIENAMFQSGDEVSKMLSEDPHQSAETAAANIGMAALLGGGIGGALGGAGELWDATIGKKVSSALGGASHALSGEELVTPLGDQFHQVSMLENAAQELKPNISQVDEAASRLGIEPTVGTRSGRKVIQDFEANLGQRGTVPGQAVAKESEAVFNKLSKTAESTLRDSTVKTEAQVGREIKSGIKETLEKELKPIEETYSGLTSDLKKVPMSLGDIMEASGRVLDHEFVGADPKFKNLADELVDRFKRITNMNDLKTQRTLISEELNEAYRAGSPKARILQEAKDALTELRAKSLQAAGDSGAVPSSVLERIQQADAGYAAYKNKLQSLGVEAGIGKVNNARALLDRFAKSSDESFATKIFDTGDINQLKFFKDNFPKEFELARRFKLKEIFDNSISHAQGKNGKFEIGKFLAQVKDGKLGPEARDILFQGHGQTIEDLRTIYQAMPGNPNPSGTAAAMSFGKMFTVGGLLDNATDAVKYAILKSIPHLEEAMQGVGKGPASELAALKFASNIEKGVDASAFRQMANFIAETIKGENKFAKATSAVFDSAKIVLPSKLFPEQKERDRLDQRLKDLQSNNGSGLLEMGGKVGHYMPDHGMAVAQVAANAAGYLNSLRPPTEKKSPLDSDVVPNSFQKAQFSRALDIAQEPLVVLDSIKEGTLTPQDVVTFKKIYPQLYARTGQKLMNNLIDTVHKGNNVPYRTRLGLSMFLGQPLDSTMTPNGILSAQPKALQTPQLGPQQNSRAKGSMKDLGKLAMADLTPLQARQASKIR